MLEEERPRGTVEDQQREEPGRNHPEVGVSPEQTEGSDGHDQEQQEDQRYDRRTRAEEDGAHAPDQLRHRFPDGHGIQSGPLGDHRLRDRGTVVPGRDGRPYGSRSDEPGPGSDKRAGAAFRPAAPELSPDGEGHQGSEDGTLGPQQHRRPRRCSGPGEATFHE